MPGLVSRVRTEILRPSPAVIQEKRDAPVKEPVELGKLVLIRWTGLTRRILFLLRCVEQEVLMNMFCQVRGLVYQTGDQEPVPIRSADEFIGPTLSRVLSNTEFFPHKAPTFYRPAQGRADASQSRLSQAGGRRREQRPHD